MPSKKSNFEEQLADLEKIANNLENGNIPLDEALEQFQAGVEIGRDLEKKLTTAKEAVAESVDKDGIEHELDPQSAAAPEE